MKNPAFCLKTVNVFLSVGILCANFRRRRLEYLLVLGKRIGEAVFADVARCGMRLTHFRKFKVATSVGAEDGPHRAKLLYMSNQVVQMYPGLSFGAVVRAVKEHTRLNFILVIFTYVLIINFWSLARPANILVSSVQLWVKGKERTVMTLKLVKQCERGWVRCGRLSESVVKTHQLWLQFTHPIVIQLASQSVADCSLQQICVFHHFKLNK